MSVTSDESVTSPKCDTMGPLRVLGLSAMLVIAQPVGAAEPAPDAQALGTAEALVSFCAKVDPAAAARHQQYAKLIAQGADEKVVAEVRKSDEYKQSFDAMNGLLEDVTEEDGRRTCTKSLADNN